MANMHFGESCQVSSKDGAWQLRVVGASEGRGEPRGKVATDRLYRGQASALCLRRWTIIDGKVGMTSTSSPQPCREQPVAMSLSLGLVLAIDLRLEQGRETTH